MGSASSDSTVATEGSTVSNTEAKEELESLLSDLEFHCTDRHRKFLRFVTEELFQGRGNAVKAYSIAVDVFGRPPDFDPSVDPIVRIEATRLRAALATYYELHGHSRPVRIELPRGRYVPVFVRSQAGVEQEAASTTKPGGRASQSLQPTRQSRLASIVTSKWLSAALCTAGGILLGVLLAPGPGERMQRQIVSQKPRLAIEFNLADGVTEDEAAAVRDALAVALSGFQTLRLSVPAAMTASVGKGDGSDETAVQGRYRLLLKYGKDRAGYMLWWQVVDDARGEAVRSGIERSLPDGSGSMPLAERLASQLAVRLASSRGIINTLEAAQEVNRPTLGNGCVLRAMAAADAMELKAVGEARDCLEKTLALREADADAHATLAGVLLRLDRADAPTELTDLALAHAARAVALAPDSGRSFFARMVTQHRIGNLDAAIEAGRRALALNPNDSRTMAKLAYILFVSGTWDEGARLASGAPLQGEFFDDAEFTLAFDAYRRGEFGEVLWRLRQIVGQDCYRVQTLEIATLGQLGRFDQARVAIDALHRERPYFEASLESDLARRGYAPALVQLIKAGLGKAGVPTT